MMDLQSESTRLEMALEQAAEGWRAQLKDVDAQILEYEKILADKESKTDRSENATFQIASDGKSAKMAVRKMLTEKLEVYENHKTGYTPSGVVQEGSTVALSTNGSTRVVKIVPHGLSDALRDLVDISSAVGKAALGLAVGATFSVKTRRGKVIYKIEGVY